MKIIHCSDLHLDSKMETHLTKQQSAERKAELLETFSRMVHYAAQNQVSVIMICGDLFDTARVSSTTVGCILDTVAQRLRRRGFFYHEPPLLGVEAVEELAERRTMPSSEDWMTRARSVLVRVTTMILPQVHLRKPCYDFSFL